MHLFSEYCISIMFLFYFYFIFVCTIQQCLMKRSNTT
uniref:Uncharacterized protein n=1 Tax=Anguilla anguilla TaxID=7936 RepID=A0A0E9VI47_ANGAN